MTEGTTYDVRVYRTEVYKGARVTTYKVRWKTDRRYGRKASATPRWPTASAAPC